MQTQTIFKTGNSNVVAIPKDLSSEIGFFPGLEVVVSRIPNEESIVIRKVGKAKKTKNNNVIDKEFKSWMNGVLKEDEEILDELALC